ncbi:MAG TPA: minor capsid protein [Rummeliibacillus sp.]|nr:minor capsid protein [Rummeliibacillus sp.]
MIRFSIKVDVSKLQDKVDQAIKKAQFALDEQIIKDSNFYAPEDIGTLIGSAQRGSKIGEGLIVWDTPYARRLYYNPQYNFSKDKNPNAGGLWFERAKAAHRSSWQAIAQHKINESI